MTHVATPTRGALPPSRGSGDGVRGVIRGFGELLITLGVVVALFVFYEVYVTDWLSAQKQHDATAQLDQAWQNHRGFQDRPLDGTGIAKIYIPSFGPDFVFTVLQGTGADVLAVGPGHYPDTAMPGQPGDFAVAGHRVGKGSPFNDLDLLRSCDSIVIETVDHWFVYRVLPLRGEAPQWAGRAAQPQCAGVAPLAAPYENVVGKEIVLPSQREVIAPVPGRPGLVPPPGQEQRLITLTTCHPQFSARERLIVHGILVAQYPKVPGQRPAELNPA